MGIGYMASTNKIKANPSIILPITSNDISKFIKRYVTDKKFIQIGELLYKIVGFKELIIDDIKYMKLQLQALDDIIKISNINMDELNYIASSIGENKDLKEVSIDVTSIDFEAHMSDNFLSNNSVDDASSMYSMRSTFKINSEPLTYAFKKLCETGQVFYEDRGNLRMIEPLIDETSLLTVESSSIFVVSSDIYSDGKKIAIIRDNTQDTSEKHIRVDEYDITDTKCGDTKPKATSFWSKVLMRKKT